MTSDEFKDFCWDICPHCYSGVALRYREDTREWIHESDVKLKSGHFMSHFVCFGTHFRNKWKDKLSG